MDKIQPVLPRGKMATITIKSLKQTSDDIGWVHQGKNPSSGQAWEPFHLEISQSVKYFTLASNEWYS
jgi:hypothetical protein